LRKNIRGIKRHKPARKEERDIQERRIVREVYSKEIIWVVG